MAINGTAGGWGGSPATAAMLHYILDANTDAGVPDALQTFAMDNDWKNSLFVPAAVRAALPHALTIWLRNFTAGCALYYGAGFLWALAIYGVCRSRYFKDGGMPTWEAMRAQMWVSQKALVWYTFFPSVAEWMVEKGFTRAVYTVAELGGWTNYLLVHALYLFIVEFCIYWIHRGLHDVSWLRWLHTDHHIYNKENTLSPFAGLAFHPLDGIAQASPYVLCLFFLPIHFWTFEVMLFATGVWTTNIHDTVVGRTEPLMGAAYHTIHHTTYKHNYGQYFIFWDWVFGTLEVPDYAHLGNSMQGTRATELKAESKKVQ